MDYFYTKANKPTALITASASGEKAHEQLKFELSTLGAKLNEQTQVLISGVKGKINENVIVDKATLVKLEKLIQCLRIECSLKQKEFLPMK